MTRKVLWPQESWKVSQSDALSRLRWGQQWAQGPVSAPPPPHGSVFLAVLITLS